MPQSEAFDTVILGSGQGGKQLAWHLAGSGRKVAVVERRWVGGSCPAVACMPSNNELSSARVAHLVRNAAHFGTVLVETKDDRILGFAMIGSEAGEVVAAVQAAVQMAMLAEMPYTKLRNAAFAHLTIAEGLGPLFDGMPPRPL
jgi:pyruvate/2-oxoglutarate dehydrogenase complex dihydrolipoamide dehydrogenase (E3) component